MYTFTIAASLYNWKYFFLILVLSCRIEQSCFSINCNWHQRKFVCVFCKQSRRYVLTYLCVLTSKSFIGIKFSSYYETKFCFQIFFANVCNKLLKEVTEIFFTIKRYANDYWIEFTTTSVLSFSELSSLASISPVNLRVCWAAVIVQHTFQIRRAFVNLTQYFLRDKLGRHFTYGAVKLQFHLCSSECQTHPMPRILGLQYMHELKNSEVKIKAVQKIIHIYENVDCIIHDLACKIGPRAIQEGLFP